MKACSRAELNPNNDRADQRNRTTRRRPAKAQSPGARKDEKAAATIAPKRIKTPAAASEMPERKRNRRRSSAVRSKGTPNSSAPMKLRDDPTDAG